MARMGAVMTRRTEQCAAVVLALPIAVAVLAAWAFWLTVMMLVWCVLTPLEWATRP